MANCLLLQTSGSRVLQTNNVDRLTLTSDCTPVTNDPNPATYTFRDDGHTLTYRDRGHTLTSQDTYTLTRREHR